MIQTLKLSSLEENIVYQCSLAELFFEVTLLASQSCVIRNASASRCFLSFAASRQLPASSKTALSGFIRRNLVIQTLKLSSLEENTVYQCFIAALFFEVTFLVRQSCVIRNASASRFCFSFEASRQLPASPKKALSGFIWRNLVIQTLKLSSLE